jgi:hypothetical protein
LSGCRCSRKNWSTCADCHKLHPVTAAVQRKTQTIPIVFVTVVDPIRAGFVASLYLSRAGISLAWSIWKISIASKCVGLLMDIAPSVKRVAMIFNPEAAPGGGSFFSALIRGGCPIAQRRADHSASREVGSWPCRMPSCLSSCCNYLSGSQKQSPSGGCTTEILCQGRRFGFRKDRQGARPRGTAEAHLHRRRGGRLDTALLHPEVARLVISGFIVLW